MAEIMINCLMFTRKLVRANGVIMVSAVLKHIDGVSNVLQSSCLVSEYSQTTLMSVSTDAYRTLYAKG